MPIRQKRLLTPDEVLHLRRGASAPEPDEVQQEEEVHNERPSRGKLAAGGALLTRLLGGLVSGVVGAAPTPLTTLGAGAIGGAAEIAAQKIESAAPIDKSTVGTEAVLSAIPLSKIYKWGKAGTSIGKQLLANVVRGAGVAEGGNILRRYNATGNILPQTRTEAAFDVGTSALGGALGRLGMGKANAQIAAKEAEAEAARLASKDKFQQLANAIEPTLVSKPNKELVQLTKVRKHGSASGEVRPTGLRVKPFEYGRGEVDPALIAKGRTVENPAQFRGDHLGAASVEESAPISGGVATEQDIIARKQSSVHPENLDSQGIARKPAIVRQELDFQTKKAADIAKIQRKVNEQARKEEQRLLAAEQKADLEDTRKTQGGLHISDIKAGAAKAETKNAEQVAKEAQKAADATAKQAKINEAQKKIDDLIESGGKVGPRVLTETTEGVPTASGKQVMRQSITEQLDDPAEAAARKELEDFPRGPAPEPTPVAKPVIPKTDPNIVGKTMYPTQMKALEALAGSGRAGKPQGMGRGKWRVVFDAEEAAKPVVPEVPKVVEPEVPPVAKVSEPPVVEAKPPEILHVVPPVAEVKPPIFPQEPPAAPPAVPEAPPKPPVAPVAKPVAGKGIAPGRLVKRLIEPAKAVPEAPPAVKLPVGPSKGTIPAAVKAEAPIVKAAEIAAAKPRDVNDLVQAEKTAWDKYWDLKKAKAPDAEIRAAGKAAGEVKAELAKAVKEAEAAGKPVPFAKAPEKAPPVAGKRGPKSKDPDSDAIMAMPPAEQEKALTDAVAKFKAATKGKNKGEAGYGVNQALIHAGLTSAGALAGAAAMPDDPLTGALLGGGAVGAGYFAPSAFRAVMRHIDEGGMDPRIREASLNSVADWLYDKTAAFMSMVPDYYRGSLLSSGEGLMANSLVGPYGSVAMGAIERAFGGEVGGLELLKKLNPVTFGKRFLSHLDEAESLLHNETSRAEMSGAGPEWFRWLSSRPAKPMMAGDLASKGTMMDAGIPEVEARQINLTSEPQWAVNKAVGNLRKSKEHGKASWIVQMILPFYRTHANQVEQSALRFPGLSLLVRRTMQLAPEETRPMLAKWFVSGNVSALSYAAGTVTPPEHQKNVAKYLTNFMGPYGTTAKIFFAMGVANQNGAKPGKQITAAATSFLNDDMAMPTGSTAFTDAVKMWDAAIDDSKKTSPMSHIPYGVVPPMVSSKERYSIPSLMRDPKGFVNNTVEGTKKEYSVFVPFVHKPELKSTPHSLTAGEKKIKKYEREERAYKTKLKQDSGE